ncbi:hypothetical protein C1I98_09985 [Spongiactinospora gelatinilytica]|uniref:Uncharacterized protein n=1 Tax=Spongiactinospora gelatinilytica TaxID=2666298 RepID=A0A2W2IL24_9ACTN|nr:hypothetical protein [Spongiactinospora gelatinilytica]PZG50724.1 hypothetical protein C1I98_09985 [Spongiactinospora gelatinilytica]
MIWDDEMDDDALSTVVVDAAYGRVLAGPFIRTHLLGGWLTADLLSFREEYDDLHRLQRLDMTTGQVITGPTIPGRVWAAVAGRHVHEVDELEDHHAEDTTFYTTDVGFAARRPLFTLHPKVEVRSFFLAAGVSLPSPR